MAHWIICLKSYTLDNVEVNKGQMSYHTSTRSVVNPKWRKATEYEVSKKETKKNVNYLPPTYWTF